MSKKIFESEQPMVTEDDPQVVRTALNWKELYNDLKYGARDRSVQNLERPRFGHKT